MSTMSMRRQTSNSHGFQHKKTIDKIFNNKLNKNYDSLKEKCFQHIQVIGCDCTDCNGKRLKGNCVIETLSKYVEYKINSKINSKINEERVSILRVSYL